MALCGLMKILHNNEQGKWKPVCRWEEDFPVIKLGASDCINKNKFVKAVYDGVKKDLETMKENWKDDITNGNSVFPIYCDYGKKKSPFWMADVKPKKTAEKLFKNLKEDHIKDSLFKKWDYGERSTDKKRKGDRNKYTIVGNFCWDPIYSQRKQYKLGYPPNEESPPVEAGANALAGCGWEVFPPTPKGKDIVGAPCHFTKNILYPLWDEWSGFEEIKSLLWLDLRKANQNQLKSMGIKRFALVEIEIAKKGGGKRVRTGKLVSSPV